MANHHSASADPKSVIAQFASLVFQPDDVLEVRALHAGRPGRTKFGFMAAEKVPLMAWQIAAVADEPGASVYFTPHRLNPAVLQRAKNVIVELRAKLNGDGKGNAKDSDVLERRYLVVDIDPTRPADTNATDAEKAACREVAGPVRECFAAHHWPAPLVVDSGNGFHLYYRLPATEPGGPVGDSAADPIARVLKGLNAQFSTAAAKVDTTVYNAARIFRLPGSTNRKGPDEPDRPHRPVRIEDVPDDWNPGVYIPADGTPVPTPTLELADELSPVVAQPAERSARGGTGRQSTPARSGALTPFERAVAYVTSPNTPPAVQGNNGHSQLFDVARTVCLGFDLGEDDGFRVLWGHYNRRCVPPFTSESEVRRKCREAVTKPFGKDSGWMLEEDNRVSRVSPSVTDGCDTRFSPQTLGEEELEDADPSSVTSVTPSGEFCVGDRVVMPDWKNIGVVQLALGGGAYVVRTTNPVTGRSLDHTVDGSTLTRAGGSDSGGELSDARPYKPFPVDLLPGPVADFVRAVSHAIPCDPSFVAVPALATLAGAVGMARVLQLKADWQEPPIVWGAIVGESGSIKSPAQDIATRPLIDIDLRLGADNDKDMRQYQAKMKEFARAKKDAEKSGIPCTEDVPERPISRRAFIQDATVESIAVILSENPKGVLASRDELDAWFQGMARYTKGSDRPQWLSMHGGKPLAVDRKTGDKLTVRAPHAAVSVCGGIQPGILKEAMTKENMASGLAARLLFAMPPRQAKVWTEEETPVEIKTRYASVVERLFGLELTPGPNGHPVPIAVTLSTEARSSWANFVNEWGQKVYTADQAEASAFSKLEGYAARLALLHHLVLCVDTGSDGLPPLPLASLEAGIALAEWFAEEASRVYDYLSEGAAAAVVRLIMDKIRRMKGRQVTVRDVARATRKNKKEVQDAMDQLVKHGWGTWIEYPPPSRGGHPIRKFQLAKSPETRDTRDTRDARLPPDDATSCNATVNGDPGTVFECHNTPVTLGDTRDTRHVAAATNEDVLASIGN